MEATPCLFAMCLHCGNKNTTRFHLTKNLILILAGTFKNFRLNKIQVRWKAIVENMQAIKIDLSACLSGLTGHISNATLQSFKSQDFFFAQLEVSEWTFFVFNYRNYFLIETF